MKQGRRRREPGKDGGNSPSGPWRLQEHYTLKSDNPNCSLHRAGLCRLGQGIRRGEGPGSERRLRGGDPEVDLEHDPQRACIHQRRRETTRDFCYIDNVVQANLLAATVDDPAAVNEVYNVALNERISLNELFAILRSMLEQRY